MGVEAAGKAAVVAGGAGSATGFDDVHRGGLAAAVTVGKAAAEITGMPCAGPAEELAAADRAAGGEDVGTADATPVSAGVAAATPEGAGPGCGLNMAKETTVAAAAATAITAITATTPFWDRGGAGSDADASREADPSVA